MSMGSRFLCNEGILRLDGTEAFVDGKGCSHKVVQDTPFFANTVNRGLTASMVRRE